MLLIVKMAVAVVMALLLGNGAVVWFNHFPLRWFEDPETGTLPPALLAQGDGQRQRLPSTPWKALCVGFLGISGAFLALRGSLQYEVAVLCVLFLVMEMCLCDLRYQVIPDQLQILLACSAIGFAGLYDRLWEPLAGAALGLVLGLSVYGLGRLLYRRTVIGGADLKFYLGIGMVTGREGVLLIFVLTALCSALHLGYLVLTRRYQPGEQRPMLPYALAAVTLYLLFLRDALALLLL